MTCSAVRDDMLGGLTARFGRHPRFWPDLIRAAVSADNQFRALSRLTIIPMAIAERQHFLSADGD